SADTLRNSRLFIRRIYWTMACANPIVDPVMLSSKSLSRVLLVAALLAGVFVLRPFGQAAPPQNAALRFRYMGPESAGRISAVAGVPGDSLTYYAGAASGGVWKTTDGAKTFAPVFDAQPVQAIGALALSASSPNLVWAGTGEAWTIRDADVMGDGIYK